MSISNADVSGSSEIPARGDVEALRDRIAELEQHMQARAAQQTAELAALTAANMHLLDALRAVVAGRSWKLAAAGRSAGRALRDLRRTAPSLTALRSRISGTPATVGVVDAASTESARRGLPLENCLFYHVMDLPGHGTVGSMWDLRSNVDAYVGHFDFRNKRVLEIGPASGFLTFEMERRGADVLALEIEDDPGWDFVPYSPRVLGPELGPRRDVMRRLKNSWWFARECFQAKAQLIYGDAYALPDSIGRFDVAVLGSVLLHTKAPLQVVEQCAKHTDTLIITDLFYPELEGQPVARLVPTATNESWDTWWQFSTTFLLQFLGVLGFKDNVVTTHIQIHKGHQYPLFTIVAKR